MNPLARLFALLAVCCAAPLSAQSYAVVVYEWVEVAQEPRASRYVSPEPDQAEHAAIATYGPFRVIDAHTAELVGVTDRRSPASFAALHGCHAPTSSGATTATAATETGTTASSPIMGRVEPATPPTAEEDAGRS